MWAIFRNGTTCKTAIYAKCMFPNASEAKLKVIGSGAESSLVTKKFFNKIN